MMRGRPRHVFAASSFPSDTSMEMPYRLAPEQSHAQSSASPSSINKVAVL
jgi:hypothetical protein